MHEVVAKLSGMTGGRRPVAWFRAPGSSGLARQVRNFFGSTNTRTCGNASAGAIKGVWEPLNLLEGRQFTS